jgi:hypothetical protein
MSNYTLGVISMFTTSKLIIPWRSKALIQNGHGKKRNLEVKIGEP